MHRRTILLALTLLTAAPVFAAEVDLSKLPPAADKKGVTFDADIKPIFGASCVGCHGAQRPKAGLRLDSLEGVLKGGKDGKVLTVGDSAKSPLVIAVSRLDPHSAMPPQRKRVIANGAVEGGKPADPNGNPPANPPHEEHPPAAEATPPAGGPGGEPRRGGMQGPPPKPLTAEQVGLVRAWIDQGAK